MLPPLLLCMHNFVRTSGRHVRFGARAGRVNNNNAIPSQKHSEKCKQQMATVTFVLVTSRYCVGTVPARLAQNPAPVAATPTVSM